jgi:hypothetical protein
LVFSRKSSFSITDRAFVTGSTDGAACTLLKSPKSSSSAIETIGAGGGGMKDGNAKGISCTEGVNNVVG